MSESMGTAWGQGVIRLHRRKGFYRDLWRSYQVRIDGDLVGKIAAGETKDFPVPTGEHRIRLVIDRFYTSREVTLQVREGDLAGLTCSAGPAIQSPFALLWPRRYILLSDPIVTSRI